jgi:hypothetical protein
MQKAIEDSTQPPLQDIIQDETGVFENPTVESPPESEQKPFAHGSERSIVAAKQKQKAKKKKTKKKQKVEKKQFAETTETEKTTGTKKTTKKKEEKEKQQKQQMQQTQQGGAAVFYM